MALVAAVGSRGIPSPSPWTYHPQCIVPWLGKIPGIADIRRVQRLRHRTPGLVLRIPLECWVLGLMPRIRALVRGLRHGVPRQCGVLSFVLIGSYISPVAYGYIGAFVLLPPAAFLGGSRRVLRISWASWGRFDGFRCARGRCGRFRFCGQGFLAYFYAPNTG